LDLAFSELAQQQGDAVLPLADGLWDFNSFETKLFSIILLANLKSSDHHQLIDRLAQWIQPQTDQVLVNEILNQCVHNFEILESDAFFNLIARWLNSTDMEMKKAGLKSISLVIAIKDYSNLPKIFQLLNPVIDQPIVQIQSDLLSLIRLLTSHSQAETASFLFSKYKLSNNSDVKKFIRKCIPYLDKFFVDEFGTFVQ